MFFSPKSLHSSPSMVNPRANPVFFGTAFSPVPTAIRHSLFHVLISSMPARGGQQHHSPFAISCFDFLNASQNFLNERNVYSSRDKQHHSSFTIRFFGKMDETRIRGGHHDSPFIISYFTTWMSSARAIYPIVLFAPSCDRSVREKLTLGGFIVFLLSQYFQ